MNCKHCKIELVEEELKCPNCNYPNKGTQEEKKQYVEKEIMNREIFKDAIKAYKEAQYTLFGIAGINIIIPIILVVFSSGVKIINLIVYLLGASIYLGLGFLAKKKPMIASAVGLFILLTVYFFTFLGDPSMITRYIWLKIALVTALIYAIYKGNKLVVLKRKYNYLLE